MKNNLLFEIIKKELRDIIRDKKTVITMIIVPLIVFPLFMGIMMVIQDNMLTSEEETKSKIGFDFKIDDEMNSIIEELDIEKVEDNKKELQKKLDAKELDGYLTRKDNTFYLYYSGDNQLGQITLQNVIMMIDSYEKIAQSELLLDKNINPEKFYNIYTLEEKEQSGRDFFTEYILGMIPTFIFMLATLTATIAAIDMTAGEKERGTLETLLTFPIKSSTIISGKFIATTICSIISSIISFVSTYSVIYILSSKLESFQSLELLSFQNIICALVLFIIYSMLVSAASIALASNAKSFKEAQNATQTLSLLPMVPLLLTMAGIESSFTIACIPFINVNLLLADIMSNSLNLNYFIIAIVSTILCIVITLKIVSMLYKSDKILFQ